MLLDVKSAILRFFRCMNDKKYVENIFIFLSGFQNSFDSLFWFSLQYGKACDMKSMDVNFLAKSIETFFNPP